MLAFSHISISFGKQEVLKDVSFTLTEGEKVCILGKSGSGKSVMLKLMTGLLRPDLGQVILSGQDTTGYHHRDWNRALSRVGFVFQGSALFDSLTVYENTGLKLIEEGKRPESQVKKDVVAALKKVGLDESILTKLPAELSGGMRKRVAIARAIIHHPSLIIYDEPTAGLDPGNAGIINRLIADIASGEGVTTVVVTHDRDTLERVGGRALLLADGNIAFDGKTQDFMHSTLPAVRAFWGN